MTYLLIGHSRILVTVRCPFKLLQVSCALKYYVERQVWELIGTGVRFDGRGTVLTAVGSAVYTGTLCFQQEANRIRTIA